jgi:hypothetical protein
MSADLGEVLVNVRPMDEDLAKVEQAIDRLRSDLARVPFIGKS